MMKGECIGCGKNSMLHSITGNPHGLLVGLCDDCFAIPEPRFHKTEKHISRLIEVILGKTSI